MNVIEIVIAVCGPRTTALLSLLLFHFPHFSVFCSSCKWKPFKLEKQKNQIHSFFTVHIFSHDDVVTQRKRSNLFLSSFHSVFLRNRQSYKSDLLSLAGNIFFSVRMGWIKKSRGAVCKWAISNNPFPLGYKKSFFSSVFAPKHPGTIGKNGKIDGNLEIRVGGLLMLLSWIIKGSSKWWWNKPYALWSEPTSINKFVPWILTC